MSLGPNFKEGVIYKNIDHSLQNFFFPPFLLKEEDAINDTPLQKIIGDRLHHEMMVMLSFQPMTPVLCQVAPYLPLEGYDEHKERYFFLKTKDVPHPLIEDVLDHEDIDQVEEIIID